MDGVIGEEGLKGQTIIVSSSVRLARPRAAGYPLPSLRIWHTIGLHSISGLPLKIPMSNPYQSPHQFPGPNYPGSPNDRDSTGGVIPYKNPHALIAYYSGIFCLICCITPLPLGIVPLVLGIMGLQKRAQNPNIKGSAHAWIGIVLGGISALGSIFMAIGLILSLVAGGMH